MGPVQLSNYLNERFIRRQATLSLGLTPQSNQGISVTRDIALYGGEGKGGCCVCMGAFLRPCSVLGATPSKPPLIR